MRELVLLPGFMCDADLWSDMMPGLAVLGRPRMGLLSTLTMSGVSFANAQLMVRRYVGAIRWSE